ncbi:hypothetical protein CIG75_17615 [Tumebacillus algifaecis]|uniref:Uncharacterized protein n=1 Tax=Tumebacillus algifaecis TaxID=1214604 RepID=A0A223D567_9BACL|nr:hypothetical protein [Tumebacillus algifaecis]ASS76603.1 hypothetical protein CIG75_17615 [Tumebacillus algifaecis]
MAGKVSFPFGRAGGTERSYPIGAAQGYWPGMAAGFGYFGWAIAFLVLFFIGFVFWRVWGQVGPLVGGGFFW